MNATRARHLENALLHYDVSRVGVSIPIDLFLRRYFAAHKHLKDRDVQFISEHMYDLVRWRGLLDQAGGPPYLWHNRMRTYFVSERWKGHTSNKKLPPNERAAFPLALFQRLKRSLGSEEATASVCHILNEQPVYFLRVNTLRQSVKWAYKSLLAKKIAVELCKHAEQGLVLNGAMDEKGNVTRIMEMRRGFVEFQDESNMIMGNEVDVKPGEVVLDYCAGSGGKTLVYAPKMMNKGMVYLHDIRDTILMKARPRLRNANIRNYALMQSHHPQMAKLRGKCNWVICDVPNTGTGTFRKNPDMKWSYSDAKLVELMNLQRQIFESSLQYLAPKGKIVYMTNSILEEENSQQIRYFCEKYGLYLAQEPRHALPQSKGLDGFFVAVLEKK